MKRLAVVVGTCFTLVACARPTSTAHPLSASPAAMPCEQVVSECHAKRLADVTLTGGQTDGALGSIEGLDLGSIISFDQALRRAWEEDAQRPAKTVQVTLGVADADALNWGHGRRLFYAIEWAGFCVQRISNGGVLHPVSRPPCVSHSWGTVIDAQSGAFIVGGSGS